MSYIFFYVLGEPSGGDSLFNKPLLFKIHIKIPIINKYECPKQGSATSRFNRSGRIPHRRRKGRPRVSNLQALHGGTNERPGGPGRTLLLPGVYGHLFHAPLFRVPMGQPGRSASGGRKRVHPKVRFHKTEKKNRSIKENFGTLCIYRKRPNKAGLHPKNNIIL